MVENTIHVYETCSRKASDMKPPELTVIQRAVLKHLPTLRLPPGARVLDAPCGGSAALTLALIEKGYMQSELTSTPKRKHTSEARLRK